MEEVFLLALKGLWWLLIATITTFEKLWKWMLAPPITHAKRAVGEGWRHIRADSWPRTSGTVEHIAVTEHFTEWRLEIAYSYEVDGAVYSGYLVLPFGHDRDGERVRDALPLGASLIIRYDWKHHDRPTLLLSDQECLAGLQSDAAHA